MKMRKTLPGAAIIAVAAVTLGLTAIASPATAEEVPVTPTVQVVEEIPFPPIIANTDGEAAAAQEFVCGPANDVITYQKDDRILFTDTGWTVRTDPVEGEYALRSISVLALENADVKYVFPGGVSYGNQNWADMPDRGCEVTPPASNRIGGADRYATSALIAARAFPEGAPVVYLANAFTSADALSAGSLTDGPVLLVPASGVLPASIAEAIASLSPSEVIALGGEGAVSADIHNQAIAAAQ